MISDARSPDQQNTIIANNGIIVPDRSRQAITLRLFNGSIFGVDERDADLPRNELPHLRPDGAARRGPWYG